MNCALSSASALHLLVGFVDGFGFLGHRVEDAEDDDGVGVIDLLLLLVALPFHDGIDGVDLANEWDEVAATVTASAEELGELGLLPDYGLR